MHSARIDDRHVLLAGPRGCGKSSVGAALARRLDRDLVDLDERVLARFAETSVTEAWARHGEPAWRAQEAEALSAVLADGVVPVVVALGGGTPVVPAARAAIERARARGRAVVVHLRCAPAVLRARLAAGAGDRPSLTGRDPVEEIPAVLAEREPVYAALADVEVAVEAEEPVARTAERVLAAIGAPAARPGSAAEAGRLRPR